MHTSGVLGTHTHNLASLTQISLVQWAGNYVVGQRSQSRGQRSQLQKTTPMHTSGVSVTYIPNLESLRQIALAQCSGNESGRTNERTNNERTTDRSSDDNTPWA